MIEPFELGEVSYHRGWTFHHAAANETDVPRRVMTVIYVDAEMEIARAREQVPGGRSGHLDAR